MVFLLKTKSLVVIRLVRCKEKMLHLTNKNDESHQSLQTSLKIIVIFANCFGLLPISGVTSGSASELKFHWISFKTAYSLFLLLLGAFKLIANVLYLFQKYSFPTMSMYE